MAGWKTYKRAQIENNNRIILRFDSPAPDAPVRAWLILRPKQVGAFEGKLPLYQVDNNKIHAIEKFAGIQTNNEKDYWIRWNVSSVFKICK